MNWKIVILSMMFAGVAWADGSKSGIKEWSLLIFMNGNNSLAEYTDKDLNEMEMVGSDQNINIVVQWAKKNNSTTKRLLIQKDQDSEAVTSKVVEDLPRVDMGAPNSLVEFVSWSVQKYPAKKYMIVVWDHGTGWHALPAKDNPGEGDSANSNMRRFPGRGGELRNVSRDDFSGHEISTLDLGQALRQASQVIGRKFELFGSDACSMASIEIATELMDSAKYFVASEELEDDNGWPYQLILSQLTQNPTVDGLGLGKIVADANVDNLKNGNSMGGVTMSVTDTSRLPKVLENLAELGRQIQALSTEDLYEVWSAADMSQRFWYDTDYKDAGSFFANLEVSHGEIKDELVAALKSSIEEAVVHNAVSRKYANAYGLTLWVPPFQLIYDRFGSSYRALKFEQLTGWDAALKKLVRPDQGPY